MKIRCHGLGSVVALLLIFLSASVARTQDGPSNQDSRYVFSSEKNFLDDFPAVLPDGRIHAVVEIMAGDNDKWEVKGDGKLRVDFKDGKPRVVKYLGYPLNYGMVPQTQVAKERGGDGDPLDILVIGKPLPRGTIVPVKIIGVMKMTDNKELDDKLIAVLPGTAFEEIGDIQELEAQYPGITDILRIWFKNYKKADIEIGGFLSRDAAMAVLAQAMKDYQQKKP